MENKPIIGQYNGQTVKIYDKMPKGWKTLQQAQNAPKGYKWIYNGKSRFSREYEHALLKIKK